VQYKCIVVQTIIILKQNL